MFFVVTAYPMYIQRNELLWNQFSNFELNHKYCSGIILYEIACINEVHIKFSFHPF